MPSETNSKQAVNTDAKQDLQKPRLEEIDVIRTEPNTIESSSNVIDIATSDGEDCFDDCTDIDLENSSLGSVLKFEQVPVQITGAWREFEEPTDNYTRGCKWSPDGSCILTCSNDNILRLFNFPSELWQQDFSWGDVKEMSSVLRVREGSPIYDYSWYPLMSSSDPLTCCFCSTSQGSPVHMWDAFTGELRCTYRPYNHVDEVAAAYSVAFDTTGEKLFCGFQKMIRIFDVTQPGRDFTERPTYVKKCGQLGIISCFAFSPANRSISAAGSYGKTIGIYSEPDGNLEHHLLGNCGGVTNICFSPDGTKIFSGGRKDLEILCWDLRNLDTVLYSLRRMCLTSQRMYFDISGCGQYVISGNHNGIVTVWDIMKEAKEVPMSKNPILEPILYYQAHSDCVNGISIHPTMPVIATSSGQRKFPEPVESDDENGNNAMFNYESLQRDNSVRLWWAANF